MGVKGTQRDCLEQYQELGRKGKHGPGFKRPHSAPLGKKNGKRK